MALRACPVCCRDLNGSGHAVEVTAESLYEAVAQALTIFGKEWVGEIGEDSRNCAFVSANRRSSIASA
jgi:hypothetical protein